MQEFRCSECGTLFHAEGFRKEWTDRIYGPQSKIVAVSPCCGEESSEYKKPSQKKSGNNTPLPSCGGGSCHSCPYSA